VTAPVSPRSSPQATRHPGSTSSSRQGHSRTTPT
jgi:hypothetical protein